VHNAFYAGRELGALSEEAAAYGRFMRGHGQVNALHVHEPFERVLACFTGRAKNPARLDGDGFDEQAALEAAQAAGSRSAQFIVRLLMGIVRYHFGDRREAARCLADARPFLDGVTSTWHVPMFHQYAALAGEPRADDSLAALRALAVNGSVNFAHRVALVEGARAHAKGEVGAARAAFAQAIAGAESGGWLGDLGLAHELAGNAAAANEVWRRWGAMAKLG
jgi:hypothetical protein